MNFDIGKQNLVCGLPVFNIKTRDRGRLVKDAVTPAGGCGWQVHTGGRMDVWPEDDIRLAIDIPEGFAYALRLATTQGVPIDVEMLVRWVSNKTTWNDYEQLAKRLLLARAGKADAATLARLMSDL